IFIINGNETKIVFGCPFETLKQILRQYEASEAPADFGPFCGGAIGYFSYETRFFTEKLSCKNLDDLNLPDGYFSFYDALFCFDHLEKKARIISTGLPESSTISKKQKAQKRIEEFNRIIDESQKISFPPTRIIKNPLIHSNFSKNEYIDAVKKAKKYIFEGDIFQVNLSQRFKSSITIPHFDLYKRLRRVNPAPFAAFLNVGNFSIVCSSPERFLRINNDLIETRPIKGTRPRGTTPFKDQTNAIELLESPKDNAELTMIVDLERNDLGKICEPGSVNAVLPPLLEAHPTVFHLVGEVTGRLRKGVHHVDCIKSLFPGGSVTGAPKIRAMEIIDELEPNSRGIYTGALGYFSFNRQTDLNIVIRTIIIKDDQTYFHTGGGIVMDSDPEMEYQETLDKAKALIESISKSMHLELIGE
ncbi:MAG: aminodeoxychorismate synthase component I, partial [Elusimicrobiota bacterium]